MGGVPYSCIYHWSASISLFIYSIVLNFLILAHFIPFNGD